MFGLAIFTKKYAAYNFSKNKYNCKYYLGTEIWRDEDMMRRAKEAFEKENQKWELIEIRSMATTERMPEYYAAYPKTPRPGKTGRMCAVQFVARYKESGKLVETAWLFRFAYISESLCAGHGLFRCAQSVSRDLDFLRGGVFASLEAMRRARRAKSK